MALSETEDVCPRPLVYEIVYDPPAATAGMTPSYVPGPAKGSLYLSRTPLHRTAVLCGSLTVLLSQRMSTCTWLLAAPFADLNRWPWIVSAMVHWRAGMSPLVTV